MTNPTPHRFLAITTPVNLEAEEEKFLASKTYNPIFRFNWEKKPMQALDKNKNLRQLKQAIFEQDHKLNVKFARKVFQTTFDIDTRDAAQLIVDNKPEYKRTIKMVDVAKAFQKAFDILDIDYAVNIVKKGGFYFRPNHHKRDISISYKAALQFFTIDGVVKHELTHVIRHLNGEANDLPTTLDFLPTEEGLASYMQDYHGERGDASLFQHAAEYNASLVGLNGPLREIFDYFRSLGFNKKIAWQRAARHKFGFSDTSKPGDIIKPAMYFHHEQKIKELPEDRRWILFSAKESQKQLGRLPEYQGIIPLEKLKLFFGSHFT